MKKVITSLVSLAVGVLAMSAVTLHVTVPAGTSQCYVAGAFNSWSTSSTQLQKAGGNTFEINLPDVTAAQMNEGYKYCCGPDWKYVEKGPNGEELDNRAYTDGYDTVAKWANLYEVNENLVETVIKVNGYDRKVQILLPAGYAASSQSYPVIYYVGVQQRYNNAGDDNDNGDNFFASHSWGAASRLSALPAYQANPAIMVATYSFVAENIPYHTDEFVGSGQSDAYLADFLTQVKGYVDSRYRTLSDPAHTAVMGADLGGMLSLYACGTGAFGRCLAMSPLLWINSAEMSSMLAGVSGVDIAMTYGSAEPSVIRDNLPAVGAVSVIANGTHDDDCWGEALPSYYGFLAGAAPAPASCTVSKRVEQAPQRSADIANTTYQFWCHNSDPNSLGLSGSTTFAYHTDFVKKSGTTVNAQVAVRVIPASNKSKFYWNVKRAGEDAFMLGSAKNVSFSSKKTADSWLRVVINEDESIEDIAASSIGFMMQSAAGSKTMTVKSGYTVTCNAEFLTADKSFTIHLGSVNSQSDMGAITATQSVSASCTKATIDYDFLTNRVTVTETDWGDVIESVNISLFSAVPSVTYTLDTTDITIELDEQQAFTATMTQSYNYGAPSAVTLTPAGFNRWTASIPNLQQGIYTLTLNLQRGAAKKDAAAVISVKVIGDGIVTGSPYLVADAYKDVDWASVGRYKANFHTHTSQSFDTEFRTDIVVDRYKNAGYKILALTDHDANPYPWEYFDLYNPQAAPRDPEEIGMLAIPGNELSKDNLNSWHETAATGEFNHHNDFFTGRKGQEFATLRESYAYTNALGGMQIINHPGQYWSLSTAYTPGEKNSPEWHAENFRLYPSLIGLEVYNQGNRRPNDRILWDQILNITMPGRPVWGYSCDDTHTAEQYFRNYDIMLMPSLTVGDLKTAMRQGSLYFSYEYTGSGQNLAPAINAISVDKDARTITIDTDAADVKWISGTDRSGDASTRRCTVVGIGKTFDYTRFKGSYVRALLTNDKGETCTQPFGFSLTDEPSGIQAPAAPTALTVASGKGELAVGGVDECSVYNAAGICMHHGSAGRIPLPAGIYIVVSGPEAVKAIVK